jgi:hypothetical protein
MRNTNQTLELLSRNARSRSQLPGRASHDKKMLNLTRRVAAPAGLTIKEDIVKLGFSLIALLLLAGAAIADIPPELKLPRPPQDLSGLPVQPGASEPADVLLDNPPGIDRPEPLPRWLRGPNDLPFPRRPGDVPVPMPPYDDPLVIEQVSDNPPVGDWPLGIGGQPDGPGRIPIVLPPVFRDRIDVRFGPGFGRLYGQVRLYDMNGRIVLAQPFSADGSLSVKAGALPSGSYLLELDCGPGFVMRGKVVKFE